MTKHLHFSLLSPNIVPEVTWFAQTQLCKHKLCCHGLYCHDAMMHYVMCCCLPEVVIYLILRLSKYQIILIMSQYVKPEN